MSSSEDRDRAILDLFERALEQPDEVQDAWVKEQAGGDEALYRGVMAMLEHDSADSIKLHTGGAFTAEPITDLPERIGAYKIVSIIGQGGMGVVYEGERDAGDFSHRVAIKVTRPGLVSSTLRERFEAERNILAGLSHPGIARLFDGGSMETGAPFMVMEYVEGAPILQWANKKALSLKDRLSLFEQVLEAVRYAHQNLIIHRDITPSNVLVTEDGTAKLIDFGIAKPQFTGEMKDGDQASLESLTFTPGFAAPERRAGVPANVLFDIYSLGGLLNVLTRDHDPGRELKAIIAKAMSVDPDRRYPSADAFLSDLDALKHARVVEAAGGGPLYRFAKFFTRHPLSVSSACLAVIALASGLAITTGLYQQAETARLEADKRFNDVRSLANYLLSDLDPKLEPVPGNLEARRDLAAQSQKYLDALSETSRSDAKLELETIQAYHGLARVMGSPSTRNLGMRAESAEVMQIAYDRMTAYLNESPNDPIARRSMARIAYDMNVKALFFDTDVEQASAYLDESVANWDVYANLTNLTAHETVERYDNYIASMGLLLEAGEADRAVQGLEDLEAELIAIQSKNPGVEAYDYLLAGYYVALARNMNWKFYFDEVSTEPALAPINKGIALYEDLNKRPDKDIDYTYSLTVAYFYRGEIYSEINNYASAIADLKHVIQTASAALREDPGNESYTGLLENGRKQLLYNYAISGDATGAKDLVPTVLAPLRDQLSNAPDASYSYAELANALATVGEAYELMGDLETACTYYTEGHALSVILVDRFSVDASTDAATVQPLIEAIKKCA